MKTLNKLLIKRNNASALLSPHAPPLMATLLLESQPGSTRNITMTHFVKCLFSLLFSTFVLSTGCEDDKNGFDLEGPCLGINVEHDADNNVLSFDFVKLNNAHYEVCGSFVKIFVLDDETGEKRRADLSGYCHFGCYLEETFQEPRCNEGCDMIYWTPLKELASQGDFKVRLEEMVLTGTQAPPADFEPCHWYSEEETEKKESYPVYEWQDIKGEIEIELEFGCSEKDGDNPHDADHHTATFKMTV